MEPPTPLRNADFRSLLASAPRPPLKPPTTPSHPSSTPSTSSHHPPPPPPPKSTKRLEHYQRYLAKQAARQPNTPKGSTPNLPHTRHGYRDRARERRLDDNPDYHGEVLVDGVGMSEEASKFLGGDEEHTHLVKGLDFALVRRKREEEERVQQEKLDALLVQQRQPSASASSFVPSSSASSPVPVFRSTLACAVYELVVPSPITPSELFHPGRLSYSLPLTPPSPFAQLPLALAAPAPRSTLLLSQLNQVPVSVLTAKDDLVVEAERVSGYVPPSVLRQVQVTMERKREKRRRKKQAGHTSATAQVEEGKEGSEGEGEREEMKRTERRPVTVEERRRQLMQEDDDDIFGDAPPAEAQPTANAATAPAAARLSPAAVFKPAAPTSRYFHTPSALSVTAPLPPAHESSDIAAPLAPPTSSSAPPPRPIPPPSRSAGVSSSSPSLLSDEYDELYPDGAISFSGALAGDEDSDDEANALSDKKREKEEKMQAKRGRGGRLHARGAGGMEQAEMKREEKRREAKLDSQLAGVAELLKKEAGKLRLQEFEREGAAQEAAKRLKRG